MDSHLKSINNRIILLGIVLIVFLWIADSFIDAYLLNENFVEQLFSPDSHEFSQRIVLFLEQIFFIAIIAWSLSRRTKLEQALVAAMKRAELERARSEAILADMGDGISILDTDFRVTYQNRAHKVLMGDHAREFCYASFHGKERVCDGCHMARSFDDGQNHYRETSRMINGAMQYLEIISTPLKDADGKIFAGIEAVRDVTERKVLEEKRRGAEDKVRGLAGFLQRLIDTIPNPIYYKDAQGLYLGCNKAFEVAMGLARNEIVGKTIFDLDIGSFAETFHEKDRQLLANPGVQTYESQLRYRNGSWHDVIFTKATFTDVDGKMAGLVGVMSDITEHKLAEAEIRKLNDDLLVRTTQLSASNNELESFSYSLSHDLRTFLTQVFIAAQVLEEEHMTGLDENGRFFVATIRNASENMEQLLDAMLVLAGVTRTDPHIDEVDLSQLAEQALAGLRMREPEREVEFVATPGLLVRGDMHLLRVAMENMLGNAWKYTRKSAAARIELGTTECAGETVYFVRDNGAGFAMQDAGNLFQPFKRLHSDDEFSGTGIGLATVQRVIERHGGRIWGEGEVGKGATFYFTISGRS
jgi:PAS domain S-box-containing protein